MKRIEDKFEISELNGAVFPVHPITQKLISIQSEDGVLIPIFSTKQKYEEFGAFKSLHCQEILDYKKFFDSLIEAKTRLSFHLILDPYILEGKLRFQLIPLDESDKNAINKA